MSGVPGDIGHIYRQALRDSEDPARITTLQRLTVAKLLAGGRHPDELPLMAGCREKDAWAVIRDACRLLAQQVEAELATPPGPALTAATQRPQPHPEPEPHRPELSIVHDPEPEPEPEASSPSGPQPCEVCGIQVSAEWVAKTGRARHGHHPAGAGG